MATKEKTVREQGRKQKNQEKKEKKVLTNAQRRRNKKKATPKKKSVSRKPSTTTASRNGSSNGTAKSNGRSRVASGPPKVTAMSQTQMSKMKIGDLGYFPTGSVRVNAKQPREGKDWPYIREVLIPGIQEVGQHTPGKVYRLPKPDGKIRFEIIGGEHRFWACADDELDIPFWAILADVNDADDLFLKSFVDNTGSKGYTDQELAAGIVMLRDKQKMSFVNIGKAMGGTSPQTVQMYYNLGKMPPEIQAMVAKKEIGKSVINELRAVPEVHLLDTARKIKGKPGVEARHTIEQVQKKYGRAKGAGVTRKRKTSDDRKVFESAIQVSLQKLQRMNDWHNDPAKIKAILESSSSPDANLILANRLDHIITNAIALQLAIHEELPAPAKRRVTNGFAASLLSKLQAALLSGADLSAADKKKLEALIKNAKKK